MAKCSKAATWRLKTALRWKYQLRSAGQKPFVSPFSALMPGQSRHADPFSNALRIMPMARPTNPSWVEEDLVELSALTVGSR